MRKIEEIYYEGFHNEDTSKEELLSMRGLIEDADKHELQKYNAGFFNGLKIGLGVSVVVLVAAKLK